MSDNRDGLEKFVDGVARQQPLRRAPASLQARVFAQIASQQVAPLGSMVKGASLPWWRKGFAHWPLAARAAFLIASYGFVRLALAGVMSVSNWIRSGDVAAVETLHQTGEVVSTTVTVVDLVVHAIPPMWLYGGAAVGFALYAALFGLSTFAYRTLYVQR
jgi:hypothetical protein